MIHYRVLLALAVSLGLFACNPAKSGNEEMNEPLGPGWNIVHSGANRNFSTAYFVDANTGFAAVDDAGGDGEILLYKTANGGRTWRAKPVSGTGSAETSYIYAIDFPTPSIGYAAGWDFFLKTTDGGDTWNALPTGLYAIYEVEFANADTGYGLIFPGVVKTTDGGATWDTVSHTKMSDFKVINAQIVYAVGDSSVYKTTNGGAIWSVQKPPYPTPMPLNSWVLTVMDFVDANTGYVSARGDDGFWTAGDSSLVWKTTDGGVVWNRLPSHPALLDAGNLDFVDANTGYLVYDGKVFKTQDGGVTWVDQLDKAFDGLRSIFAVDAQVVYGMGYPETVIKTTTGGE